METNNLGASNPVPGTTVTTTEVQQTEPVLDPGTTVTTTEVQTQPVPTPVTMVTPVQIVPEPVVSSLQPTPVQLQPIPVMPVQQIPPMTSTTTTVETEGKPNNKTIMILAVLIILIFLGVIGFILLNNNNAPVVNTVTPPPVSIPVTQSKTTSLILYTSNSSTAGVVDMSLLDTKTNINTNLVSDVGSASLSPDGKSILYINKPNGVGADGGQAADVDVFDIATKTSSVFLPALGSVSNATWSPDGKEVITDQGTYLTRSITIYDLATMAKLASFSTSETVSSNYSQYYWVDAANIVFMTLVNGVTPVRPAGTGGYTGISEINIQSGLVTPLLVPTDPTDYTFMGTDVLNGNIAVSMTKFTGVTASSMGTGASTYGKLDFTTGLFTADSSIVPGNSVYEQIKALLPANLAGYNVGTPVKAVEANTYYVVVNQLVDSSPTNGRIYKVDTTASAANAFTLIDTGSVDVTGVSVF